MTHLIRPNQGSNVLIDVSPASTGWHYLNFKVVSLQADQEYITSTEGLEMALVPLAGKAVVDLAGQRFDVNRAGVFVEIAHVLYVPPGMTLKVSPKQDFQFALGGAPADGRFPPRLWTPQEIRVEVRGGGAATRQVNHILAHPMPAERLILFEVFVPGGHWSGWPPHCHDGYGGSPYLEETYYFRTDPAYGFAMHRNYRVDRDFDEVFAVRDGDLVLVTEGFHATAAAPNCNLYFLNYLAGELLDESRATPLLDDPSFAWLKNEWNANAMALPLWATGPTSV